MPAASTRRIVRLRITLEMSVPEIWRLIDVDESLTLAQLHLVLQAAFGWEERHLHVFSESDPNGASNGIPRIGRKSRVWMDAWSLSESGPEHAEDEAQASVRDAFRFDGPIWYEYDLGDGWVHRIDLIERDVARLGEGPATVVRGERRAPIEDSGGIHAYTEKLAILADPSHPEHGEVDAWARWVAGPWGSIDPDAVDVVGAQHEIDLLFGEGGMDMSGLVDPALGVLDDAPIVEFAAGLPVPIRVNLRRHLRFRGLLERDRVDPAHAEELTRPYRWLLDRIGADGLQLTGAGWMRPADVSAAVTELGWRDQVYGAGNREESAIPVRRLRASAERLRLIRKQQGRLLLVARTRAIADDPMKMWDVLARMLLRQKTSEVEALAGMLLVLGLADGSITTRASAGEVVADGLTALGVADRDGGPVRPEWLPELAAPAYDVLTTMGLWPRIFGDDGPSDAIRAFARAALK